MLCELVTLRGLFDFISVCDTTNNTPARIDRNELYLDTLSNTQKQLNPLYLLNPCNTWMTGSVKLNLTTVKGGFLGGGLFGRKMINKRIILSNT